MENVTFHFSLWTVVKLQTFMRYFSEENFLSKAFSLKSMGSYCAKLVGTFVVGFDSLFSVWCRTKHLKY